MMQIPNMEQRTRSRTAVGFGLRARIACVAFLVAAAGSAWSAQPFPELHAWLAAQPNIQTWSADLTQTRKLKTLSQTLVAHGHVSFAAPNKFRWQIEKPSPTIAVSSGDTMEVIYPELKRVEKYALTGNNMGPWKDTLGLLQAGFPRSEADIERQFNIRSVSTSNDVTSVVLQPKASAARRIMPQVTILFSTRDFTLRATEMLMGDGSTMRNDFFNQQVNPKLDPILFNPPTEPGYTLVEPLSRK